MTNISAATSMHETYQLMDQHCAENVQTCTKRGTVHLIGAGSGDPELLTLKAWRVMQRAEVVLYDSLVSEDILDMCASTAEKIFVGKRRANHALPQESINELLVKHALAGKMVVRLKGGDPFILDAAAKSYRKWYVMAFILSLFQVLLPPVPLLAVQEFH